MNFTLEVWRQESRDADGRFETYQVAEIAPDESFLEMIDGLNDRLIVDGQTPIAFDNDCREGICGACSMTINGRYSSLRSSAIAPGARTARIGREVTINAASSPTWPNCDPTAATTTTTSSEAANWNPNALA